jgi:hypothetical protein
MNTLTDSTKQDIDSTKQKRTKKNNELKLNTSAFRKFAMHNGFIKMVSPKAIDEMRRYLKNYLLVPIVEEITEFIKFTMSGKSQKSFRIVQIDKLKTIIQKHILHDIDESVEIQNDTIVSKKHKDFAFHPLTFRKYIIQLTEEISRVKNIQWSSKCMEMLQIIIEHELYIIMDTCGKVLNGNSNESRKGNLKLTKKDVCFVFEARYNKR